jgi:superfamily II DNA or RNA helicase
LWIAQSDELCEQAVQTWSFIWRALGPQGSLSISRLWASNEADEVKGAVHVVVATIDKLLAGCLNSPEYKWLAQADCVVIDEAHGSVTTSYTQVLSWLGLGRSRDRCPLLGLTATPFRGVNEAETRQLVSRYGGNRLDRTALGDDPYGELQAMGVLARVRHRLLEGSEVVLTQDELKRLERTRLFPSSAEDRIGSDISRNRNLLEAIKGEPPEWPILVFATSVDHAQTMAALLTLEGIPSAAVTGATEPGARRHYIEEFRRGNIRVLTNYAVLTQGFDAPAVRAIYVARPTYSPNLYQQMIGRGLRGLLNGGTEECLIVNVKDNVQQYGEKLAFTAFEYLWSSDYTLGS